jgi:1,4-alpha-glucan branching enzyme
MDESAKKVMGAVFHGDGVVFRVWAPFANKVSVTGSFNNWTATEMNREDNGYWAVDVKGAMAGQEYRYLIDSVNGQLFKNDPRALQVNTSAGNSIIVDPDFDWEDDSFEAPSFNEQIIYELHVGTFNRADPASIGMFQNVVQKLDHLKELGINMIEVMPITSMSMVGVISF